MNTYFKKFYNRYRPASAIFVVFVFIIAFFFIPLVFSYTITIPGKVLSAKEWLVGVSGTGQITAWMIGGLHGVTENYSLHQFDRQDMMNFKLREGLSQGSFVHAGDTLGYIRSRELEMRLEILRGELASSCNFN